jgi:hypothetical protein
MPFVVKALAVALSFCRLLGLGCPKQAFAKIATPRALQKDVDDYIEFYNHRRDKTTALRLLGTTSPRVRSPWLAAIDRAVLI